RDGIARGLQAHHRLEPHLKNIFREERLEVAFHRFPETGSEGRRGHETNEMAGLFTLRRRVALPGRFRPHLHPPAEQKNLCPAIMKLGYEKGKYKTLMASCYLPHC